ncbi:hypothetical protein K435DRAFT_871985 [Dendrothele bispora CBS 962.96]|uniref:Uncharacterized protein n=1 Tax=Dendrothele bispora (strain CBS 962.96) TaxID=1314807 RepID=A0A4S8L2W2_DENBC|nr:hypothetical protein K435DRAFT_871985 [Dendrothele bispora CBS 962.96]
MGYHFDWSDAIFTFLAQLPPSLESLQNSLGEWANTWWFSLLDCSDYGGASSTSAPSSSTRTSNRSTNDRSDHDRSNDNRPPAQAANGGHDVICTPNPVTTMSSNDNLVNLYLACPAPSDNIPSIACAGHALDEVKSSDVDSSSIMTSFNVILDSGTNRHLLRD